ncbi:MAG: GNAT family N-acetyltransferase [Oscillospiraceae bacterium]|jgi:predicted acetyltransferase|nr:GNAT family N-acetyltransferase [Oscillospiraceae bacterium]
MLFRSAREADRGSIARLWSECFPGDEKFCGLFLERIFSGENTVLAEEDGEAVSMTHFILQELDYLGQRVPCGYIFGVGTAASFRGRGIAGGCMRETLRLLRSRGAVLALVVPASGSLFDYYARFDFSPEFFIAKKKIFRKDFPTGGAVCGAGLGREHIPSMDRLLQDTQKFRIHLNRSPEHWENAVCTAELFGGGILTLAEGKELKGYGIYEFCGGELTVNELFAEDEASYNSLMAAVMDKCGVPEGNHSSPACPRDAERYGMVRVLDARRFLEAAAELRQTMDCEFALSDEILPQNSRRYSVKGARVEEKEAAAAAYITMGQLAKVLFGAGQPPYMNLLFS